MLNCVIDCFQGNRDTTKPPGVFSSIPLSRGELHEPYRQMPAMVATGDPGSVGFYFYFGC